MAKAFASQADTEKKRVSFTKLAPGRAYAYTTEGDPNTGVVIGDECVMVIDTQATPAMAQDVIAKIRTVTDKPIKYVALTHYHAVRVLGASAYGAEHILASQDTRDLIAERGAQDMASEIGRFPRLFEGAESIPGLTWPTLTFTGEMRLFLGELEVRLMQLGRGHTKGDTVVWLPKEEVLFSGDLVEYGATPYTGDAYLSEWPQTLDRLQALGAKVLVPGRGDALVSPRRHQSRHRRHTRLRARHVRSGQSRNRGWKAAQGHLQARLCVAKAEIRRLGYLRPLPAIRCLARP